MASSDDPSEHEAFVQAAYRAVLHRDADEKGLAHFAKQLAVARLTPTKLLNTLLESAERRRLTERTRQAIGDVARVGAMRDFVTPVSAARAAQLRSGTTQYQNAVDDAYKALEARGRLKINPTFEEYYRFHRRRFAENCNAIAWMRTERRKPSDEAFSLLEIGSGLTVMLYKEVFPDLAVGSADLFPNSFIEDIVFGQWQIDLQEVDTRTHYMTPDVQFDALTFCEVLEHLVVNPVNLFKMLSRSVKIGGFLYVTTPNFFAKHNRDKISQHRNPQHIFPERFGPADRFHYHIREYTLPEVLEAMQEAGLQVYTFYYSECWEKPENIGQRNDDQLQNIVAIAQRTF